MIMKFHVNHSSDVPALRQSQHDLLSVRSCIVSSAMKVPQTNPRDSRQNMRHMFAQSSPFISVATGLR